MLEQNPTMSYKKALDNITVNKAYKNTTVVGGERNRGVPVLRRTAGCTRSAAIAGWGCGTSASGTLNPKPKTRNPKP